MRKNSMKNTRINGEVQRVLAEIIRGDLKDPRIGPLTSVLSVEVAQDLKTCKAYISVYGDEKVQKEFELYRIAVRRNINIPHFPLTTNYRQMRHIDRQADNAAFRIRTKAEIGRIITGYEAAEGLELLGIEEGGRGQIGQRGNAYRYIPEGRESLLLRFRGKKESFLSEDQVLFLVEEVQSYYPQFLVTGELSF